MVLLVKFHSLTVRGVAYAIPLGVCPPERNSMATWIKVNIGDLCTSCGNDTAMYSGRFVNRIPSFCEATLKIHIMDQPELDAEVEGYMCEECQESPH